MPSLKSLQVHRVRIPLLGHFTTAVRSASELETVLVQAVDDDGRQGWGEAPVSRVTGVTTEQVAASVEGPLWALVKGVDLAEPEPALERLERSPEPAAARMAVDCALHDLAAQHRELSLAHYLAQSMTRFPAQPGAARTAVAPLAGVPTDMTLSIAGPEELATAAAGHVSNGFDTLKIKLGSRGDAVAALRAVRAAVGSAVTLRVDANQAFQPAEAVRVIRALEDAGLAVELVEQPVAAGDWQGLAEVSAAVGTPVMADESVRTLADLQTLLRYRAAPMINIMLAKTGGLRHARSLLERATAEGIGVVIGCMLESPVGIAAAASLAATMGSGRDGMRDQDLDGGLWLRTSPVSGGARYEGKVIRLAPGPGLGIGALSPLPAP
jgi:L-alanine-DL-glutamate epimerase-like enolase superfamily enzyme